MSGWSRTSMAWLAWAVIVATAMPAAAQSDPLPAWLRSKNDDVEEGNALLRQGDAKAALQAYDEAARALPNESGVHLNRGLALMQLGDLEAAQEALQLAGRPGDQNDKAVRAQGYLALGTSAYRRGEAAAEQGDHGAARQAFQAAADALKQSLRLHPGDANAAWNLELSLRRLREEKEKEEQQQKEEQQNQDEQDEGKQDQGEQDKQQGDQDEQDKQQGDQDEQDKQQGEQDKQQGDQDEQDQGKQQDEQEQDKQDQGKQQDEQEQDKQDQGKQQDEQDKQPQEAPLPTDVRQALDALQAGEENLERHRARQRAARERRRPLKDW